MGSSVGRLGRYSGVHWVPCGDRYNQFEGVQSCVLLMAELHEKMGGGEV